MKLNELKNKAQERIASLKEAFETQDNSAAEMDLTRTAYPIELGTRHPLSIVKNEIIDIFHRLGFSIADGPEIEDDLHVFTAMNFAETILHVICKILSSSKPIRKDVKKEHRTSHSHLFRTGKSYGTFATSYPHHLSGTCIPQ